MAEFKPVGGAAVGGDVQELKTFAQHLTSKSIPDFERIFAEIEQKISQTTWSGSDAKTFSSEWQQQSTSLKNTFKSALEGISQKAVAQANAQEQVSQA